MCEIKDGQTWYEKTTGMAVLIMRVADIYVLYQNTQGDLANRHPMIFLQDFINIDGLERGEVL